MDNYIIAEQGVKEAASILEIKTPLVAVFNNKDTNNRNINSIFLKDNYTICFNKVWLDSADPIEVLITCFHETRHAFQWNTINEVYFGNEKIDKETIKIWEKEMNHYTQPTNSQIIDEDYVKQTIEIDAIAFAHYHIDCLFDVKTAIPKIKKKAVKIKIDKWEGK